MKKTSRCLRARVLPALSTLIVLAACGGGSSIPTPRPLVIFSGARITPDAEKMQEVDGWFREQMHEIERDPSFMIITLPSDSAVHPWETLEVQGDTARIAYAQGVPEAEAIYLIYAHFHLMAERDELAEWLPEAENAEGFELEHAVLNRVADAWLYGRSVYDATPHAPLDEILYARENGFLDAMILTAREDDFGSEREAWLESDPEALEEYRLWFEETFARNPPGFREAS